MRIQKQLAQRYRSKITRGGKNQCWHWRGSVDRKGYGTIYVQNELHNPGKQLKAHRFTYELYYGAIPPGKVVSHTCRTPDCQNPRHLKLLDKREPSLRENKPLLTHCPKGHTYTEANTKYHNKTGGRMCRTCSRIAALRYSHRIRADQTGKTPYVPNHYNRKKPLKYQIASY